MKVQEIIKSENIERTLIQALSRIHLDGPVHSQDFETLAYAKKFHDKTFRLYENKLLNLLGLFYKTGRITSLLEALYANYAEDIQQDTGRLFTPVQASAYKLIMEKTYFSFSAPTSSGKSYLFRELIKGATGDIIIVLPSRALIAEYFKVVSETVDKSTLVLQFVEVVNTRKCLKRIYIITPERGEELFGHADQLNVEFLLFDEAQISEEDIRGMRFDAFVRRTDKTFPNAKKVFTHPFINNPDAQLKKHNFQRNSGSQRYDQNAVGKLFIRKSDKGFEYFSPFAKKRDFVSTDLDIVAEKISSKGTVLIYTSKLKIYSNTILNDFDQYISLCETIRIWSARSLVKKLKNFIGASSSGTKRSDLVDMMEKGIVIHHGSMPLKARLLVEEFVNKGYSRICFSTSTLTQGINMPFDIVWINNFKFRGSSDQKNLDLKNLIGRAGRSNSAKKQFDYGYVIIEDANVRTFCSRISRPSNLSETSRLDQDISQVPDDVKDLAEAVQKDSFDNQFQLTNEQVKRIQEAQLQDSISLILDELLKDGFPINAREYYKISKPKRKRIKEAFKEIFVAHLRRKDLNKGENGVLSASIPMLLWRIQGKSFKEIVSLRHAYITQKDEQRKISARRKKGELSADEMLQETLSIKLKFSPQATTIPNANAKHVPLFGKDATIKDFSYDLLVYDTYDYLDKVLALSLTNPISAALDIYFTQTNDNRATILKNYIKYGTNDSVEIWLLRYGFEFDDVKWIKEYVKEIDASQIVFHSSISQLPKDMFKVIERFV